MGKERMTKSMTNNKTLDRKKIINFQDSFQDLRGKVCGYGGEEGPSRRKFGVAQPPLKYPCLQL